MKKTLMAVAVGAALAAPAASYAAVEISGRINAGIGQWSATGSASSTTDHKSRLRVWDSGSNITIKAAEDLGGGLKVDSYIETGLNADQGDGNGQAGSSSIQNSTSTVPLSNSATGFPGSRQAWVGLAGNFGKITFGKQNTWYGSGDQDLTQAVYMDAGVQFATGNIAAGPLVARLTNSFRYNSPKLGPVEVVVTYSPTSEAAAAGAETDGKVQAITVQGAQGQFSGGIDMVTNQAASTAAGSGAKRAANKIRGGFKYQPGAQVSVIYVAGSVKAAVTGTETKQTALQVNWEHAMGNIGLHAGYGKANKVSVGGTDTPNSGTTALQFGVRFIHSKTTWSYINYVAYTNESAAALDFNAGGMSSAAGGLTAGADPKSLAFGISHRF